MRQPRCDRVFGARPYDNSTGGVPVAPLATKDSSFCWHHLASSLYIFLFASQAACMHTFNMWYTEMYNSHQFTVYLLCNVVQITVWCTILSEKNRRRFKGWRSMKIWDLKLPRRWFRGVRPSSRPLHVDTGVKEVWRPRLLEEKTLPGPYTDKFTEPTIHVVSSRAADAS